MMKHNEWIHAATAINRKLDALYITEKALLEGATANLNARIKAENRLKRKLDALKGAVVMLAGTSPYTDDAALIVSDLDEAWEERADD